MSTEFPYLQVTTEMKNVVGKCNKGTRIFRREGSYNEAGKWFLELDELFKDRFVSPGGVAMFVSASRAAVHKRMNEGRLTVFCFHVVHQEKTFFGKLRKAKATPFVCIPVSEIKAWAKELAEKREPLEAVDPVVASGEFLDKDPADRKNPKVRYTDKYVERDAENWAQQDIAEAKKEKDQNK